MVNETQLVEVIKQAKESDKERKFTQSVEMIIVFRDVDVKKGFAINETVQLPKKATKPASVCIMASGDMGTKAKNAKADMVMDENDVTKLSADKKKSKKIIDEYDFFLADTKLMPTVGKTLGQLLGISEISSISEVTGRFDIMIQVYAQDLEDLHAVVIEKIGKIEGIQNTETFVELQKTDKEPAYLIKPT